MSTSQSMVLESVSGNIDMLVDQLLIHAYLKGLRPYSFRFGYQESAIRVEMEFEDMGLEKEQLQERSRRSAELAESGRELPWVDAFKCA